MANGIYSYGGDTVDYALKYGAIQLQNEMMHQGIPKKKEKKEKKKKGKKGKKEKQPKPPQQVAAFQIDTTLHGYPMLGPFTPSRQDVWYCDHEKCKYTQHGVYRRYNIQNWRSKQFGKKFVLCDGCVRQFAKVQRTPQQIQQIQQPQQMGQSNVNVKLNINGGYQPGAAPMQQQPYVQQPMYAQQQPMMMGQQLQQMQYQQEQQPPPPQAYQSYGQQQAVYNQPAMQQPHFTGGNGGNQGVSQRQINVVQAPIQLDQEQKVNGNGNGNDKNGGIQIVKQGWMMKKGDIVKSWKKRYFVLKTNKTLNYYETDNAVMVKGTCLLNKVKSVKTKSGQSFEIETPKRNWCFACKDKKTRDEWVAKVKAVAEV